MCTSPNAKVHGILTMMSLIKAPRKTFDTITTIDFYRVNHHLLQSFSSAAIPRAPMHGCNTNLLHSFIKRDRHTHTHIYIYIHINTSSVSDCRFCLFKNVEFKDGMGLRLGNGISPHFAFLRGGV